MNSPKIRFKKFNEDWKISNFRSILEEFVDVSIVEDQYDMLSSTNTGMEKRLRQISASSNIGYKIIDNGDLVLSPQNLRLGNININSIGKGLVSPSYKTFKFINVDSSFIKPQLRTVNMLNKYKLASVQGASVVRRNLDMDRFYDITINIPESTEEQTKIGEMFQSITDLIDQQQLKIDKIKQLKQSFLKKMFPKMGMTVPEIRFKGFEGDWKEFNFTKITYPAGEKNRDNLPLESYSVSNEKGFLPQKEQFENGGSMAKADKRMYYIVKPNSFVYNPARINVGSIGYSNLNKDVIVSSLYEVFQTTDNIDDTFLRYRFKTDVFPKLIEKFQEGGVRLYFYYDKLCMCNIRIPEIEEQRRIGKFFLNIDKKIESSEQKLEKLKNLRESLLQKMFI